MIDWDAIRPGLQDLICDLSELQTMWIDKPRPFIDPKKQAYVLLSARSSEEIGIDEKRFEDSLAAAPSPNITETMAGLRRLNLDVRVESFRHEDHRFAFNAAERIQTRLNFESSLVRLLALNIAIIRKNQIVNVPNVVNDDRITSVAVLDLELAVAFCIADDSEDNKLHSIEKVENPFDHVDTKFNPPC